MFQFVPLNTSTPIEHTFNTLKIGVGANEKVDFTKNDSTTLPLTADTPALPPLENLMIQYGNSTWAYVFSLVNNHSLADDLAQETFLRCWLHRSQFRGDSSIKTWLFVIAKNVCRDYFRSSFARRVELRAPEELADELGVIQDLADAAAIQTDVWAAVMQLNVKYREIVMLHLREDLSFREIAKITGSNAGTLRIRYQRAIKLLRTQLQKGVDAYE